MPSTTRTRTTTDPATPAPWLSAEARVDLSRAGVPVQLLDDEQSPWYVSPEARPHYPGRRMDVRRAEAMIAEWQPKPSGGDPRHRILGSTVEEVWLLRQADRLGWPADTPHGHVTTARLTPGTWPAWVLHAAAAHKATAEAARQTRIAQRDQRDTDRNRRLHTCTICGSTDYDTVTVRTITDPATADQPDAATRVAARRDVRCCQPCLHAIELEQAEAKRQAARAWLTGRAAT